ncbi:DHA2 family efflux MFS transporter permease subunit [Ornithinimicrobium panacihumi]|uniref:DHA2 family efflux MFS transporter permease subunit n=1 Tax=Ornithinimicrobium panacihumi TaxID=2008449 RepID=UPI003F8904E1
MSSSLPRTTTTVLRTLTVAAFVVILNETLLVNALPQLMESLQVDERAVQWLTTGFMLTLAVVIPTTGWLIRRLGIRPTFRLAMGLFLTGTLICLLSPTFVVLLLGRVVQASGTAIMMPLLMTTLLNLVPPHARGQVMGNVTLTIAVAPAMGPAVSGIILRWLSWHWLFGLVLPIALVVTIIGLRALRVADTPDLDGPRPQLDPVSVVLNAIGFGSLIYGLAEAGGEGSTALVPAPTALVVGALGLGLFVWRQLVLQRTGEPLLDLRTLRHVQFLAALLLTSVGFMALMGVMILLPLYLQQVRGFTVLESGLLLMPGGLVMGLMGPLVGRWFDRLGSRPLVVPGAFVLLLSLSAMALATLGAPSWVFLVCHIVASVGLALMFTPAFTGGLGALPHDLYPYGSAMIGTIQQVAAAAGTAASIAVLSLRQDALLGSGVGDLAALEGGVRWALALAVILSVVVVVISFFVRTRPEPAGEPADAVEQPHTPAPLG